MILRRPNIEFYESELIVSADRTTREYLRQWRGWPKENFPIIFHAVRGKDEREGTSPSFLNMDEITMVKAYVEKLQRGFGVRVADEDIGTFFEGQCSRVCAYLMLYS